MESSVCSDTSEQDDVTVEKKIVPTDETEQDEDRWANIPLCMTIRAVPLKWWMDGNSLLLLSLDPHLSIY